jgi:hypothetical protein
VRYKYGARQTSTRIHRKARVHTRRVQRRRRNVRHVYNRRRYVRHSVRERSVTQNARTSSWPGTGTFFR